MIAQIVVFSRKTDAQRKKNFANGNPIAITGKTKFAEIS